MAEIGGCLGCGAHNPTSLFALMALKAAYEPLLSEGKAAGPRRGPAMVTAVKRPLGSGEPLVTAVWKTLSIVVLLLTALIPVAALTGNRHWSDIPLVILALYATAFAASCLYNKIRYGVMGVAESAPVAVAPVAIDPDRPPNDRRPRGPSRLHHRRTRRLLDDIEYELGRRPPTPPRRKRARM